MRSLDTYNGRSLTELTNNEDGTWQVGLEGDIVILNTDKSQPFPRVDTDLRKLYLAVVILSEENTIMVLNDKNGEEWRIILNPTQYQIYDPTVEGGSFSPQLPVEAQPESAIPPHPDERIAEGPDNQDEDDGA